MKLLIEIFHNSELGAPLKWRISRIFDIRARQTRVLERGEAQTALAAMSAISQSLDITKAGMTVDLP